MVQKMAKSMDYYQKGLHKSTRLITLYRKRSTKHHKLLLQEVMKSRKIEILCLGKVFDVSSGA